MMRVPLLLLLTAPVRAAVVDDVTRLNPVVVERVVAPESIDEVRTLVRDHDGPISIGGGRFSMGGQTASEDTLHIDTRRLDHLLSFSPEHKTITIEAGMTWRKIQELIDPYGLSVKIMQSYANFTVGGSLSVNGHGRYVNQGPLIRSVRSIRVVAADGSLVEASPGKNSEVFYGAIGGYGALGVIVAATLDLAENSPVERADVTLRLSEYPNWFNQNIRGSTTAVFHNADIYPPDYEDAVAITFSETSRAPTVPDRLRKKRKRYPFSRLTALWVSELPKGKELREKAYDPLRLRGSPVVWRNFEASYDVRELEPRSRERTTYALQEYFVPVARFHEFAPRMAEVLRRYGVNVVNVSIRHALEDPGTLLAWAREESFAFVVYYKQGTASHERSEVGTWTRELIDAVIASGGTYYLPYQLHAREDQFHAAYPRAGEFFALKKKLDPDYRLRNKLWDKYLPPPAPVKALTEAEKKLRARKDYGRPEEQTFLTLPEWHIVYSADELASHLKDRRPSSFPYIKSVSQFWDIAGTMKATTVGRYPANWGYRVMTWVIGGSFSAEYALKGAYEKTVGRVCELFYRDNGADRFAAQAAAKYAAFIHHTPFYSYPYLRTLKEFWSVPGGPGLIRPLERRASFSVEMLLKGLWSVGIRAGTGAMYGEEASEVLAWVRPGAKDPAGIRVVERLPGGTLLVAVPRYEPFTDAVRALTGQGVRFIEIAGNRRILLTVLAPKDWDRGRLWGDVRHQWPVLTEPGRKRVALEASVGQLHRVLPALAREGTVLEHIYDY